MQQGSISRERERDWSPKWSTTSIFSSPYLTAQISLPKFKFKLSGQWLGS